MPQLASPIEQLRERGVSNPEEFADHPDLVARGIAWFDRQNGRVGAGVLVNHLRRGVKRSVETQPVATATLSMEVVRDWLTANAPELVIDGEPHWAAVIEGWQICWRKRLPVAALADQLERLAAAVRRRDPEHAA